MLLGFSILIISISYLVYRHPPAIWSLWTGAGLPDAPKRLGDGKSSPPAEEKEQDRDVKEEEREEAKEDSPFMVPPVPPVREPTIVPESSPSPQTTPKATAVGGNGHPVPSFSLEEHESSDEEEDSAPPPSFPALNSAQRVSAQPSLMAPPPRPLPNRGPPSALTLMPPPSLQASNLRALPTSANSLRIPSTGPLPNRGPPTQANTSLNLPPSLSAKAPKPRAKVLKPGHSPLDWAMLLRSGANLSGVTSLQRVTPSQLKQHNGRKGRPAWSSWQGKVYNMTPYVPYHPGGEGEILRAAGKDGTKLFMEVHPWVNWENMLGECLVGIMVGENEGAAKPESSLEEMD